MLKYFSYNINTLQKFIINNTLQKFFTPLNKHLSSILETVLCFFSKLSIAQKHTLSKPAASSLLPRTSPTPAKSVTGFSPIGSATKFLCFWDVLDILNLKY
ncbi:hypothetical protein V1477_011916 [Vespula maculifrons]|uniref:Uncharacterized protein n=1 Tax=Vespula maculifrons TaxID=7453 RepID=A0ABD2C0K1_VESMC